MRSDAGIDYGAVHSIDIHDYLISSTVSCCVLVAVDKGLDLREKLK